MSRATLAARAIRNAIARGLDPRDTSTAYRAPRPKRRAATPHRTTRSK